LEDEFGLDQIAESLGRARSAIQKWFDAYREGGVEKLLTKSKGNGPEGVVPEHVFEQMKQMNLLRKSGHRKCIMEHNPMTGKRYSEEFKNDAVRHWIESGKSGEEVARELGISKWSLKRWKTAYLKRLDGKAQKDSAEMKPSEMEAEIRRLRKELRHVEEQREILKKAVIFFGQDNERNSRL